MKAQVPAQRGASGVLADRMAAALVHREPGWQLPRRSALARRYNVSMAEIDVAIGELARRSLIRRLPDGQLYRASPAEYLIPVEGIGGLSTQLDPMGGESAVRPGTCRSGTRRRTWPGRSAPRASVRFGSSAACGRSGPSRSPSRPPTCPGRRPGPDADDLASFQAMLQAPPEATPGTRPRTRGRWTSSSRRRSRRSPAASGCCRASRPSRSRSGSTTRRRGRRSASPRSPSSRDQFRVVIQVGDGLPRAAHPDD